MIALAGKGPAVYPMGDYWQAIAYRKARPRRCSGALDAIYPRVNELLEQNKAAH